MNKAGAGKSHRRIKLFAILLSLLSILFIASSEPLTPAYSLSNNKPMSHNNLIDGALFDPSGNHYCSASVLKSKGHNLLTSASHCINKSDENTSYFIAGYNSSLKNPFKWRIIGHYNDDEWSKNSNDNYDYTVLKVAPLKINGKLTNIQDYVGDGLIPTNKIKNGMKINVTGYNDGVNDPISCDSILDIKNGKPSFNCKNFSSGVSGSPFEYDDPLMGNRYLVGIIGGYQQGGCTTDLSYSSPLDSKVINKLKKKAKNSESNSKIPSSIKNDCS